MRASLLLSPAGVVLILFALAFLSYLASSKTAFSRIILILAGLFSIGAFAYQLSVFRKPVITEFGNFMAPFGIVFYTTQFNLLAALLFSLLFFMLAFYYVFEKERNGYFYPLLILHYAAGVGLLFTADFFNFFVLFEIFTISLYAAVASSRAKAKLHGALKMMILGSAGAVIILVAIALIYLSFNTLNMADVSKHIYSVSGDIRMLILVLLTIGFAVELKLFPMNVWIKDVYKESGITLLGIISSFSGAILLVAVYRIYYFVFPATGINFLYFMGLITMYAAAAAALSTKNVLSLFGLSSALQLGFVLVALNLRNAVTTQFAVNQLFAIGFIEAFIFLLLSVTKTKSYDAKEFTALYYRYPYLAGIFGVLLIMYAGFPPSPVFWTKIGILWGFFNGGHYLLGVLIMFPLVIEIIYLTKLIIIIFTDVEINFVEEKFKIGGYILAAAVLCLLIIGVFPQKTYHLFSPVYDSLSGRITFIKTVMRGIL